MNTALLFFVAFASAAAFGAESPPQHGQDSGAMRQETITLVATQGQRYALTLRRTQTGDRTTNEAGEPSARYSHWLEATDKKSRAVARLWELPPSAAAWKARDFAIGLRDDSRGLLVWSLRGYFVHAYEFTIPQDFANVQPYDPWCSKLIPATGTGREWFHPNLLVAHRAWSVVKHRDFSVGPVSWLAEEQSWQVGLVESGRGSFVFTRKANEDRWQLAPIERQPRRD